MKLSLAWIFDHIASLSSSSPGTTFAGKPRRWDDYKINELLPLLTGISAEIDHVHEIDITWDSFSLVKVIAVAANELTTESSEWRKKILLPPRTDARHGGYFLVKKDGTTIRWATLADVGADKEGLMPELWCAEHDAAGAWKAECEARDYILEVDNNSITNRSDLWGHRGFAREMAVALGLDLVPEEHIIHSLPVQHYTSASNGAAYVITLATPTCTRYAGLELVNVAATPSLPWMAIRLARVDTRARNVLIDFTNYVMFDLGQPMHAFDAAQLHGATIVVRQARAGEKLALLDDTTIELSERDCVIADDQRACALAGIIGGLASSVGSATNRVLLEAAHFEPMEIRKSAARHKKRTESSLRFEKGIDPNSNTAALLRYVKLLDDAQVPYTLSGPVISVGPLAPEKTIVIEHRFIVDRLGASILPDRIEEILRRLGFGVTISEGQRGGIYTLTVPSWRAAKDIAIKEDIVEEVGRCFGYNNIHPVLPTRVMAPQDHSHVYFMRAVKQHCAFALNMREVANYSLYDEHLLQRLGLNVEHAPRLKNPVSEHLVRLVTSLVPNLLKNISMNCANEAHLRFFEWAKVWKMTPEDAVDERDVCAGIIYDRDGKVEFYASKALVQSLFASLGLLVEWRRASRVDTWMNPFQTAELVCQGVVIGYAGMVRDECMMKIERGTAFVFELSVTRIFDLGRLESHFVEPSKYQSVDLDISMLVPYEVTVADLEQALAHVDVRVKDIAIVDVFEKDEWRGQRSVTMRCRLQDDEKTMTKEEIEQLQKAFHAAVVRLGVTVR